MTARPSTILLHRQQEQGSDGREDPDLEVMVHMLP